MILAACLAIQLASTTVGFGRLDGKYSGPMVYADDVLRQEKSFVVDVEVKSSGSNAVTFLWRFNFDPPKFSESLEPAQVTDDGKKFLSQGDEKLEFSLKNWSKFSAGKSDWFEIQRPVEKGDKKGTFRRRFTIQKDALIGEKWLKWGKEPEYRSHKMTLKRLKT